MSNQQLSVNDDLLLCDRILQIGHRMRQNVFKWQFDGKSSKLSFWW